MMRIIISNCLARRVNDIEFVGGIGYVAIQDAIDDAMVFHSYDDAFKALGRLPDNMWAYGKVCRVRYGFEEVEPCIDAQWQALLYLDI